MKRKMSAPVKALRILIIDNYDSFSYNLFQYFGELLEGKGEVIVKRNDEITPAGIRKLRCDALVLSPGPGNPDGAGVTLAAIRELHRELPILGVCLGHQAIGQVFGGKVVRAPQPVHGKSTEVSHSRSDLFAGVKKPLTVGRYHSLVVERKSFPGPLEITAETGDGLVMALRHREYPVWGVQFHPESILTPEGKQLIRNFLALVENPGVDSPSRRNSRPLTRAADGATSPPKGGEVMNEISATSHKRERGVKLMTSPPLGGAVGASSRRVRGRSVRKTRR